MNGSRMRHISFGGAIEAPPASAIAAAREEADTARSEPAVIVLGRMAADTSTIQAVVRQLPYDDANYVSNLQLIRRIGMRLAERAAALLDAELGEKAVAHAAE